MLGRDGQRTEALVTATLVHSRPTLPGEELQPRFKASAC